MRELRQNWLDIFHGFRIALDFKKMILAFVGLMFSLLVITIFLAIASFMQVWPHALWAWLDFLRFPISGFRDFMQVALPHLNPCSPVFGVADAIFIVITGLALLVIWSYFGGAIFRICAVEFARDERIDVNEATSFARKKYWSFFWGPVVPCLGMLAFAVCILIGGVVGRIGLGIGPLIVGVFYGLALLAGFLIVLIGIGVTFGVGLMFPTVAVEGTDAFDAISRAFSYIYSRPWHFIWYSLVALAYGVACVGFVIGFALLMSALSLKVGALGMGANFAPINYALTYRELASPQNANWGHQVATVLMGAALLVVVGLALGYAISYKCTALTAIYFLMRKAVDGTDMTEVYREEEEAEQVEAPAPSAEKPKEESPAPTTETAAQKPAEQPAEQQAEEKPATEEEAEEEETSGDNPGEQKPKRSRRKKAE